MPGVPPDALPKLKSALKGLFRRNKKSKTSAATPTSSQPVQQQAPPSSSEAAPPQLPPIQNASPIQSVNATDADVNKSLPPTHPLATGQQDQPQQAVPVNEEAKPGPPAPIVGPAETSDGLQEQKKSAESATPISPPTQLTSAQPPSSQPVSAVDGASSGAQSGDVSAVTNEARLEEDVKTDSAVETSKVEGPAVVTEQSSAPNNENIPPNPTTSTSTASPVDEIATTNGTPAPGTAVTSDEQPPASPEEKVAILNEEPPPIKTSKPAPGMSATSGPLEDFPEGGDMRDP